MQININAQSVRVEQEYIASEAFPFGRINPDAPKEIADYSDLIGICDCVSMRRNADGVFKDSVATEWKFKYIMNGMAVQDETLKADGVHSMSVRQYNSDSMTWHVTYFSVGRALPNTPQVWKGGLQTDGNIVLFMNQNAPNGTEGYSRLTFSNISPEGFNWIGEWVDKSETVVFPFWKIDCMKRKDHN